MNRFSPLLLRAGLRYMRRHRWQALLALTGIALGVAVVLAVDLANSGARAAFEQSAQQLQGQATHRLAVPGASLPDDVYVGLLRQSGAPPMAPVVNGWVGIEGHKGRFQLLGLDLFAEGPFRGELASVSNQSGFTADWLTQPGSLVISGSMARTLGVEQGDRLNILYRGNSVSFNVLHVETSASAALDGLLLVDIATAKAALQMQGQLSYADLILDAEMETWIRQRIPSGVALQTVADQAQGVTRLSAAFELNLTAMSLLALLVGMFLIFNAMTFSMVQRRNLFGRLRAIGITPYELFRLVLLEAVVLAVVGTSIGLLLGIWLGQGLTQLVAATVSELYYNVSVTALHLDTGSLLIAIFLGVLATLVATLIPAWHAAHTPPLTTLSRAALEQTTRNAVPIWALVGLVLLLTGLLLALVLPGGVIMSFAGLFSLVLGAAMMTPMVIRLLQRLLASAALSGIWRMVVRDLDRHLSRLGIAVAALMVALSASVGVAVMVDSMRGSVNTWLSDLLSADLYVAAEGFDQGALLSPQLVDDVAGLRTVAAMSRYRERKLPIAGRQVEVIGAHLAAQSRQGFDLLGVAGKTWASFDDGAVLVSEPLAWHLGLKPGDSLQLPTPAGQQGVTVAAIFRDYASEHGRIFIDESVFLRLWPEQQINTLALFARDADIDAMRTAVSEFAEQHAIVITSAGAILQESMAVFDRTFRVTEVLRIVSLLVAFIGVLSALMALQLERGKEYAVLRALGLTRGQVAGLISLESLLMGLLAALVAIPVGILMAWVLIESVQRRAFGWTMPFSVDTTLLMQTLLVGLLAAGLASLYPAWRSSRRDPAATVEGRVSMRSYLSFILLLLALVLSACDAPPPQTAPAMRVDEAMGSPPDPGFARAVEPREFRFPQDHGAHPDFATEWWYLTGNLYSDHGRRFGYQLTLFRVGLRPGEAARDSVWRSNQVYMGHLAISDITGARHYSGERFARAAAGLAGARAAPFEVWLGPWKLHSDGELFPLAVEAQQHDFGLSLQVEAGDKPMVLQGERGLSRKSATPGNASYYYSFTRLPTNGEVRIGEARFEVQGDSWLDREWSSSALDKHQSGWDWFALQLDDGRELMFYQLRTREGMMHAFSSGILVEKDGSVQKLLPDQVELSPLRYWQADDGTDYPIDWRLLVADHQLNLKVKAALDDQLMDHSVHYWEGAVDVSGSHRGQGYLELSGYAGNP